MKTSNLFASLENRFQINIDTVEFDVEGASVRDLNITTVTLKGPDGQTRYSNSNRVSIHGVDGRHSLQIRYKEYPEHRGRPGILHVEGSPFANTYGQNVYTSASLRQACILALRRIAKQIDFTAPDEAWARWKAGQIELRRVDLAVNFNLGSPEAVRSYLDRLAHQVVSQRCHSHVHDKYVSVIPRDGSEYSITVYAKGEQLKYNQKAEADPRFLRLVEESQALMRIEVRLRHSELKKLKLATVGNWTPERAREVFRTYAGRLPTLDVLSGPLQLAELGDLPNNLRPVYALHKAGTDLNMIYPKRTLARHRAMLRKRGTDINCPAVPDAPRNDDLTARPMKTPQWMIEERIAPRKKRRTKQNIKTKSRPMS
ncbi:phage/plasmid replication protein, II/X family [Burkholderia gladioli]|uniref:phage/plasmid replication protein, II/X family n=1 Tax=Burkholderia gladioli TaxID=28095 RepID=UPI00163E950E|nr:phage/plasmid replication protein, II/X family [Burkholderia gladioli]